MSDLGYPRDMLEEVFGPVDEDDRTIVDTIFFASLLVEEGEPVRVALVHKADGAAG